MPYEPYATAEYYLEEYKGRLIQEEELGKALRQASRHIDALTFNRIVGEFEHLTEFQKETIREVVCRQADFETENADILDSILSSYSVNGVSMSFNGQAWNIYTDKGIAVKKSDYALLEQTGLTCRLAV